MCMYYIGHLVTVQYSLLMIDYIIIVYYFNFSHGQIIFESDTQLHGIDLYRYIIAPHVFSNSSLYPPNEGYYAYNYSHGLLNVSIIYPFGELCISSDNHTYIHMHAHIHLHMHTQSCGHAKHNYCPGIEPGNF